MEIGIRLPFSILIEYVFCRNDSFIYSIYIMATSPLPFVIIRDRTLIVTFRLTLKLKHPLPKLKISARDLHSIYVK